MKEKPTSENNHFFLWIFFHLRIQNGYFTTLASKARTFSVKRLGFKLKVKIEQSRMEMEVMTVYWGGLSSACGNNDDDMNEQIDARCKRAPFERNFMEQDTNWDLKLTTTHISPSSNLFDQN